MEKAKSLRYQRQILLPEIGSEGQKKIREGSVLVIGAGGLGCPALQYLAAAGVGHIGIVDFDTVDESNLQRQILFTAEDIGQPKALCAKRSLNKLNPDVDVKTYSFALTSENALEIIAAYELVLDGSDNFRTRYLVNDACVILKKPFVAGSVYRFEGQLSVFNYREGPTYRCLYPEAGELASCAEAGILGALPGTMGCLMATEALKLITGAGEVLSGKLLLYNALKGSMNTFAFHAVESNKRLTSIQPFEENCITHSSEISREELQSWKNTHKIFTLLDVREQTEYERNNLGGMLIPLNELPQKFHLLSKQDPIVVHCQRGIRSRKAVQLLMEEGYTEVYSLAGGIEAWGVEFKV
jgi:molybdopterin/thiamine biosynthesis adenylyltransferase/rhodanese-related sulfurtransferase